MASRWRPVLAVFLATCVIAAGVVIVVLSQQGGASTPGAASDTTYLVATAEIRRQTASLRASSIPPTKYTPTPRPTLTVDSGCRLGAGPGRLVEIPSGVRQRVDAAWERIERWLTANAPATAATLAKPASTADILAAQRDAGVGLPAELVASLLRHDGAIGGQAGTFTLPPFYEPLSAKRIAADAKVMCDVLVDLGEDGSVGYWWHGQFVPVAVDNGGDSLFLDLRKGTGRLGRHYNEDNVSFDRLPASLTELLERTADVLEGRIPVLEHSRPSVTPQGTLDWEIVR